MDDHFERVNHDTRKAFSTLSASMQAFVDDEILRCIDDTRYYLENYHVIKTEQDGFKTLYPFWDSQELFFEAMMELRAGGQAVRILCLKARQLGLSTIAEGAIFQKTIFTPGINAAVVAQDPRQAEYLFNMSRTAYDSLPWWMRPEARYEAKNHFAFDKRDDQERLISPGLRSNIYVEAANKMSGVLVGKTIRAAHLSELSRWANASVLAEEIFPAMNASDTLAILESTARGRGNFFHELWKAAWEGKIAWHPIFIPFYRVKKYSLPVPASVQLVLNNEEKAVRAKVQEEENFTITDEQFYWKRKKMEEFATLQGDDSNFFQEYPSANWLEAFQGSGLCAFSKRKLHELMATTCCPPLWYGELDPNTKTPRAPKIRLHKVAKEERIPPTEEYGARLHIWEQPKQGETYYIGVDVALGVKGGDYSVAEVIKIGKRHEPDEQVAEWHGWENPTPFGDILAGLGYWYNNAQIAVETNGIGDTTNNHLLRVVEYENLFRWKHYDKIKNFMTDFFGWQTTHKTRGKMVNALREAIDRTGVILRSTDLIDECLDFGQSDSNQRYEGQNDNDDRVMAIAIAEFCAHDSDFGAQAAQAPRIDKTDRRDFCNTDFSHIHDREGIRRQMYYERHVPADYILLDTLDSTQGNQDDDWRTY